MGIRLRKLKQKRDEALAKRAAADAGDTVLFVTAVNCIHGRAQAPLTAYLRNRWHASYVDMVTEPGVVEVIAKNRNRSIVQSVHRRVDMSRKAHDSKHLAIAAHHDCGASPYSREVQVKWVSTAVTRLAKKYPYTEIVGVWIDDTFSVHEVAVNAPDRGPHKSFAMEDPSAGRTTFDDASWGGTRSMARSRRAAPQGPTVENVPIDVEPSHSGPRARRALRWLVVGLGVYAFTRNVFGPAIDRIALIALGLMVVGGYLAPLRTRASD